MSGEHRSEAGPDIESAIQELRKDVGDIATSVAGLGYEVQALVTILRFYVKHQTRSDPLAGSLYAEDEEPSGDPQPPGWVVRASRPQADVGRHRVGCILLAALFAALLVGLYVLGRLVA